MKAKAAATSHSLPLPPPFILSPTRPDAPPPIPTSAPTLLPPLLLPSVSHKEDRPEVNLPLWKRLCIALGPRYEVGESSAAAVARPTEGLRADYGFVATMDREIRRDPERYVGYGITDSWDDAEIERAAYESSKVMSLRTTVHAQMSEITELQSAYRSRQRAILDLLETNHGRHEEMRELRAADRTGHHTAGAGDSFTGTDDGITGA
ncbi:hypothetical protein Tco_1077099, partial [Tanacetum coccineum]